MRNLNFFLLFTLCACSSSLQVRDKKYLVLKELWEKSSKRAEAIKELGGGFSQVDSGIVYTYPNSKRPEIGLFFDSSDRLIEQFVFIDEKSLVQFKASIHCKWNETEEERAIAHYYRTIKKGSCPKLNIYYEAFPDINAYEVRWKK